MERCTVADTPPPPSRKKRGKNWRSLPFFSRLHKQSMNFGPLVTVSSARKRKYTEGGFKYFKIFLARQPCKRRNWPKTYRYRKSFQVYKEILSFLHKKRLFQMRMLSKKQIVYLYAIATLNAPCQRVNWKQSFALYFTSNYMQKLPHLSRHSGAS